MSSSSLFTYRSGRLENLYIPYFRIYGKGKCCICIGSTIWKYWCCSFDVHSDSILFVGIFTSLHTMRCSYCIYKKRDGKQVGSMCCYLAMCYRLGLYIYSTYNRTSRGSSLILNIFSRVSHTWSSVFCLH